MNQTKRNPTVVIFGVILIVLGIIIFIASTCELSEIQNTTSRWAEGFMQEYQARTNATNSIPCYMFMVLSVVMIITGIIMIAMKPKTNVVILEKAYSASSYMETDENMQSTHLNYCSNCGNKISADFKFCKKCGNPLK